MEANLRLVVSVAKKSRERRTPILDRIQDGNEGLARAVDRWDPARGIKFSTYATSWIMECIIRKGFEAKGMIRVPIGMLMSVARVKDATHRFLHEYGRRPNTAELATILDMKESKVRASEQALYRTVSLEKASKNSDRKTTLVARLGHSKSSVPMQDMMLDVRDALSESTGLLTQKERVVVAVRYGIPDILQEHDYSEFKLSPDAITHDYQAGQKVANILGKSRSWVEQHDEKALEKLRKKLS